MALVGKRKETERTKPKDDTVIYTDGLRKIYNTSEMEVETLKEGC